METCFLLTPAEWIRHERSLFQIFVKNKCQIQQKRTWHLYKIIIAATLFQSLAWQVLFLLACSWPLLPASSWL